MLERLRQNFLARVLLGALLVFAIGPGFPLHALGDIHHTTESHAHEGDHGNHDHGAFDMATHFESGDACALDHDHDPSHAAKGSLAHLMPPALSDAGPFEGTRIHYSIDTAYLPDFEFATGPDKPPRRLLSV